MSPDARAGEPPVSVVPQPSTFAGGAETVLDALPAGVVLHDATGRPTAVNRAAEAMLGLTLPDMLDLAARAPAWTVVARDGTPLDRAQMPPVVAVRTKEPVTGVELGVDRGDGTRRWLRVDAVPLLAGASLTGVVSTLIDISAHVETEELLRASQARLGLALDATMTGTWEWDLESGRIYWSDRIEHLIGVEPGAFAGTFEAFLPLIHDEDREYVLRAFEHAVDHGDRVEIDFRVVWADGSVHWLGGRGLVVRDAAGTAVRLLGILQDVAERKEAELSREASETRLAFLSRATSVLASTLDYDATLGRLAHLAVPFLADWCALDVVADDGAIERVAISHADPDQAPLAKRLLAPPAPWWDWGVARVIRTGEPEVLLECDADALDARVGDADRRQLYREIGVRSLAILPLAARGRVLGAIWFAMAESGRAYTHSDIELAQELARRAALALDNARLFRDRTRVAKTLQASLLPPTLPEIPGIEVSARYLAAGRGNDIGGDFYDLFEMRDESWTVVIGDVCGKGPEAAAVTGLVRHTLRAAAMREERPSGMLSLLNEAILRSGDAERFCTAVVMRLEPTGDGARLALACGGHPLPYVVRAGGAVEQLGRHGMLIGPLPDPDLTDDRAELGAGDLLVLCTDGVTEASGPAGFFGADRLQTLLGQCVGLPAADVAARIERAVVEFQGADARDDVTILVLRVAPHDE